MAVTKSRGKERASYIRKVNECINYIKEELESIRDSLESRGEYTTSELVQAYKNRNDMSCFFTYAGCRINELTASGRDGTAANYRSAVNAFEHYLGSRDLSVDNLTQKTVEAFIDSQTRQGNSPNTAAFYVKQLRAIYNKAYDEGYVSSAHNPFHRIKLKGCKTPKRAIAKKEINRICGAAQAFGVITRFVHVQPLYPWHGFRGYVLPEEGKYTRQHACLPAAQDGAVVADQD